MDQNQLSDVWERGDPYEQYVGRWSRRIAPAFLSWLRIPAGRKWLDLGCGTGALCAAIMDNCSPAWLVGVEPSEGFLNAAKENLANRALLKRGSAVEIPVEDSSVDVTVSALVLNFILDQHAALAEMMRVTRNGGTIGAYVWDYAGKMEIIRLFWDSAVELNPDVAPMDEGIRFPVCNPRALKELFSVSGLREVAVASIDIPTQFASFEDYWEPFLGVQGPAAAYAASLEETERVRMRNHIKERIQIQPDGSIILTARAWAICATVTK